MADRGFDATTLRDITGAARVNLAAVNYHFGSKDALLAAVLERRVAPVNRHRLELLDRAEAATAGGAVDLDVLLRALLEPPFRLFVARDDRSAKFLHLMGRIHSDPHPQARSILLGQFGEVIRRFVSAFRRTLPDLEADELGWRILFIIGAMVGTMNESPLPPEFEGSRPHSPEEVLDALVRFAAAGMKAPAGARRSAVMA
ncbi:MAG: TetR/AcrR family transcriptional regulator [Gemmatimonadetes bacterium]|nr:TetR/AcrR family transcriptional regulator [Gemmatimonadota bacterium]